MKKITKRISSPHIQNQDLVEKITAFVQGGIRYDYEKLEAMGFGNSSKKFPYETLFEKAGVCEDKSILLAKLLTHNNYDICLFSYAEANHMALGIKVPEGFGNYGTEYCFIESTGYHEIGNIPEKMAGNIVLDKDPDIITINPDINGSKVYHGIIKLKNKYDRLRSMYGEGYNNANKISKLLFIKKSQINKRNNAIKLKMDQIEKQMDQIEKQMDEMKTGENVPSELVGKYNELNELRNEYVEKYNYLRGFHLVKVDSINQIVAKINKENEIEKAES